MLTKTMTTISGEQLADALHALGVDFVISEGSAANPLNNDPLGLIVALAESSESRLRLALIPLFLQHPEYAHPARKAAQTLAPMARLTLQCYYSAAVCLQREYRGRLDALIGNKPLLPDLFSRELGLQWTNDPEMDLQRLAESHQALSGARVNWLGTYQHAARVWLKGLEIQKS